MTLPDVRTYTVRKRSVKGHQARLDMETGESILVRRFAPVSPGALLTETADGIFLRLGDGSDLQLSPAWSEEVSLSVGNMSLPLVLKEVESQPELDGFNRLTRYHYRGAKGAGRTVPLIATSSHMELPSVLGFIELTTGFLVNSPRQKALDAPFSDPSRGVAWIRWDSTTAKRWINCIARISRCVVFPEFRGLGLSHVLVESAVKYAQRRWHVGGMRPEFLEITADMLRYWPFVQKAGFRYAGETEGNEHRAARDMRYLMRKAAAVAGAGHQGMPQGGGGILSLQRARATQLRDVINETGLSLERVIEYLRTSPERLSDEDWLLLHKAYRRPKPTYLRGLTPAAERFLDARTTTKQSNGDTIRRLNAERRPTGEPLIDIRKLTIQTRTRPVSSNRSRRLQEAFGIASEMIDVPVIEELDFSANPGEIVLVTGPSGSGKSLLLDTIKLFALGNQPPDDPDGVRIRGEVRSTKSNLGEPRLCQPEIAPIDALDWLPMETALRLMAVAGLAEPQVLIRPAKTLSVGQKYRLSLALGLAEDVDLFLVDEFCETLDQFSMAAVARHLRRETTSLGMATVVATSRADPVSFSLKPDRTLILSSDGNYVWRHATDV